jgi:hypothetical protein
MATYFIGGRNIITVPSLGASNPTRTYKGGEIVSGQYSLGERVDSGFIIHLDGSRLHGVMVTPIYYGPIVYESFQVYDGTYIDGYGPYRIPSQDEFIDYIQPMLRGEVTDYLPWGLTDGWPASKPSTGGIFTSTLSGGDPENVLRYSLSTNTYGYTNTTSAELNGFLIRNF